MCGIAGIWNFEDRKVQLNDLKRFTDSISHRGPDGAGYQLLDNDCLGLGHRRLSILDLSENGKQPMSYREEKYWITFNGEIFNFLELRNELHALGYVFRTNTDTEVILASYIHWGIDCLKKFNGMWAFAIYDTDKKNLFLARDRYGVKPLHYTFESNQFAFASETIAFKSLAGHTRRINYSNMAVAIDSNNILEGLGHTIFENIYQLLPGHYLLLQKNQKPKQHRWWNTLETKTEIPPHYADQVPHFKSLFENACKLRLISDVPVATALSGGVDSSSVYCMVNHVVNSGNTVRTHSNNKTAFCATFPGTDVDERTYAEKVIAYTGGTAIFVEPDYTNLPQQILESTIRFDSITSTPLYSILEVYKGMKRNGYTVSLDGHGGDEILYGYTPTVFEVLMHAYQTGDTQLEKESESTYLNMFAPSTIDKNRAWLHSIRAQVNKQRSPLGKAKSLVKNLIGKNKADETIFNSPNNWVSSHLHVLPELSDKPYSYEHLNRAEKALARDFCLLNIPYNLRDFDRAAMQTGIEIRMPLMDYRLVQYSFSLPFSAKIGNGVTKRILRDAMKDLMPEEIRMRKNKMGFTAPVKKWLSDDISELVQDTVNSQQFRALPFLNEKAFKTEYEQKFGKNDTGTSFYVKLWTLLNASIIVSNNNK